MLISFSVENYKSFDKKQTIYFSASKIKNHPKHIIDSTDKILMYLGIYGPNSSGKSNLIDAIGLIKKIIFRGTSFLNQSNFKNKENTISSFEYILKLGGRKYQYAYKIDTKNQEICEESLYDVTRKNKKIIYKREPIIKKYSLNPGIKKRSLFLTTLEEMRDNSQVLFIGEIKKRSFASMDGIGYDEIFLVYDFFMYDMVHFSLKQTDLSNINYIRRKESILNVLKLFGIDIKDIREEQFNIDELNELVSRKKFYKILNYINNSSIKYFTLKIDNKLFSILKEKDDIKVYKIIFVYDDYETFTMNIGTLKIIELAYILISKDKLFLLDGFDYLLHPIISNKFLDLFFKVKNKNQIITTGHESLNLDFNLVRRDEIWFTDLEDSSTKLYPLENFKTERFDKKISKAYINGEYGAVPKTIEDDKPKVIILKNDYRKKSK